MKNMTPDEMAESLTGFDELAIEARFGADVTTLANTKMTTMLRALAFVHHRRQPEVTDADAYQAAMAMTLTATHALFADPEDDPMPDEPVTESGKDESEPETQPQPKLSSVLPQV